jgi:RimJ/RimL family protein N-acetyltransferase
MKSSQIELVPLSLAHCEELVHYAQDPTLWTWWLRRPPMHLPQMQQEVQTALDQQEQGIRHAYAIKHLERQELIGSTSFLNINAAHKTIEIGGTWLATPFQKSGINRQCKHLLINHAFDVLKMNRVVLQTDELNTRSRHAIEKLGSKFEGILRHDKVVWDGRIRSSALYSILKNEWHSLNQHAL